MRLDSEDSNIAYYFRWHMLHSHMNVAGWTSRRDGKPRYLFKEYTAVAATHSGSAGHHIIMEARWRPRSCDGLRTLQAGQGQTSYSFWFSWASFGSRPTRCWSQRLGASGCAPSTAG